MTSVAVVAHQHKSLGGGLADLRAELERAGVEDLLWFEVPKSKKAPKAVRAARDGGADLVFVWGGDGMVQRCLDTLAGQDLPVAIVPAGTANLLATNLGIPTDIADAVQIGLSGLRRRIDLGVVNGEHFAVMAGTGLDALMIRDADRGLKARVGRLAYVATGARHLRDQGVPTTVDLDGQRWFEGTASCVLVGNVGTLMGGVSAFPAAEPDDGRLDVGVVTAGGLLQWARVLARAATGRPDRSPFVEVQRAVAVRVRMDTKRPYELDGGDRPPTKRIDVEVKPAAVTVCVPRPAPGPSLEGAP